MSVFTRYGLKLKILILLLTYPTVSLALHAIETRNAMNNAIYNGAVIHITPMLFHHLQLGVTYQVVANQIGKSALYCDSGETYCNAENSTISQNCLNQEFIYPNKTWMCHWDGARGAHGSVSRLEVWFTGNLVTQVVATMDGGPVYRRDSGNTIYLENIQLSQT